MLNATTVTVGSGKAIHLGTDCGTMCGAAHRNGFFTAPKIVKAAEVTCKRCIKAMAARVEADHAEALIDNAKHNDAQAVAIADVQGGTQWIATDGGVAVQVTRIAADPFPRVSFRRADGQTGTLPLAWFVERYTPAHNIEDAHLEALHMAAVQDAFVEPQPEDADGAVKLLAMLASPEADDRVPNTVEAWTAYAERVKTSRDAAEADLARLLQSLDALASRWERTSQACNAVPEDPWVAVRRIMGQAGR